MSTQDLIENSDPGWGIRYVGPAPMTEVEIQTPHGVIRVKAKPGARFCLRSGMHKDAAALAGAL